jgi:hypothetical protein
MTPTLKAARERVEYILRLEGDAPEFATTGKVVVEADDLRLILAALDEQKWRPIETAPRDGTVFDTWQVSSSWQGRVIDCWIAGDDYPQWRGRVLSTDDIQMVTGPDDDATHWRPLPAPPVEVNG